MHRIDNLSRSDDERADAAWDELNERVHERETNPPEDTPCLDPPWWAYK
jgi:hypothetical protein